MYIRREQTKGEYRMLDNINIGNIIKIIVFLALFGTIVLCAWRGFKDGIIRSMCGIVAIFVALYFGGIVAKMYNNEFVGMLEPFISGITEKTVNKVLSDDKDIVIHISDKEKTEVYAVTYAASREMGLSESAATLMADEIKQECTIVNNGMMETLAEKLCLRFSYVALYALAFAFIAIALAVVINVVNVSFKIPVLKAAEPIVGTILGILRGILIMYTIAMFLRYLGIIVSDEIISGSKYIFKVVNENPLADRFGI